MVVADDGACTLQPFLKVIGAGGDRLMLPNLIQETAAAYGTTAVTAPDAPHDLMLGPTWEAAASALLQAIEDGLSASGAAAETSS